MKWQAEMAINRLAGWTIKWLGESGDERARLTLDAFVTELHASCSLLCGDSPLWNQRHRSRQAGLITGDTSGRDTT